MRKVFKLDGELCANCAGKIQAAAEKLDGVEVHDAYLQHAPLLAYAAAVAQMPRALLCGYREVAGVVSVEVHEHGHPVRDLGVGPSAPVRADPAVALVHAPHVVRADLRRLHREGRLGRDLRRRALERQAGHFRAVGRAKFTMVVAIVTMAVCRVGLAYLFVDGLGFGVLWVWVAMFADWAVRLVVYVVSFKKERPET